MQRTSLQLQNLVPINYEMYELILALLGFYKKYHFFFSPIHLMFPFLFRLGFVVSGCKRRERSKSFA